MTPFLNVNDLSLPCVHDGVICDFVAVCIDYIHTNFGQTNYKRDNFRFNSAKLYIWQNVSSFVSPGTNRIDYLARFRKASKGGESPLQIKEQIVGGIKARQSRQSGSDN